MSAEHVNGCVGRTVVVLVSHLPLYREADSHGLRPVKGRHYHGSCDKSGRSAGFNLRKGDFVAGLLEHPTRREVSCYLLLCRDSQIHSHEVGEWSRTSLVL